jgi:DNA-binding protein
MTEAKQEKATQRRRRSPRLAKSPAAEVRPEVKPEPTTEVKPEPTTEVKPEPTTEVKPEPTTEVKPEVGEKVVYVGQKPVKNYVAACLTSFSAGSTKIIVKARGRAICKAVDTVELLRRRFMKGVELRGISISTEQVTREGDRKANVSAIEITVVKT